PNSSFFFGSKLGGNSGNAGRAESGSTYPIAPREPHVDFLFGHLIHDPYRWLADPDDPRTAAWSAAQDRLFAEHVARWPQRPSWRDRLAALHDTEDVQPPQWY